MAGKAVAVDSATQTSDLEDDEESYVVEEMPNASPRVMIDTSAPFQSVEEAVIRFGGRGFWIPGSIFDADADADADADTDATANATDQHETKVSDIIKLEEKTVAMLKELQLKEKETFDILKELDLTKQLVEELQLKLSKESLNQDSSKDSVDSTNNTQTNKPDDERSRLIMSELKQAKLDLSQNTHELASIRASVESLSKTIEKEKTKTGLNVNPLAISRELREMNYEAEQFMKTAESAKSEVVRAMSEIEQRKMGLKVIEMRWLTAKKLDEAARAAESLALAEVRALSSHNESLLADNKTGRISLSIGEYSALTENARKAERLLNRSSIPLAPRRDSRLLDFNEFEFVRNEARPRTRPTTSIGEILSRKLVSRDDLEVGRRNEGGGEGRQRVSLNQMLNRHREETSPRRRREKNCDEPKGLFSRRKGLGLVHISFPLSKHGKNKIQALNHW